MKALAASAFVLIMTTNSSFAGGERFTYMKNKVICKPCLAQQAILGTKMPTSAFKTQTLKLEVWLGDQPIRIDIL